jgi:hypothetical protein
MGTAYKAAIPGATVTVSPEAPCRGRTGAPGSSPRRYASPCAWQCWRSSPIRSSAPGAEHHARWQAFEERASRGNPAPAPHHRITTEAGPEALPHPPAEYAPVTHRNAGVAGGAQINQSGPVSVGIRHEPVPAQMRRLRARVSRAVDHRELPCRPGSRAVPRLRRAGIVTGGRLPGRRPRTGQAAAPSANTSRKGAGARPVLCYSRWVNITELVIFHRSGGSSPPSDTQTGEISPEPGITRTRGQAFRPHRAVPALPSGRRP